MQTPTTLTPSCTKPPREIHNQPVHHSYSIMKAKQQLHNQPVHHSYSIMKAKNKIQPFQVTWYTHIHEKIHCSSKQKLLSNRPPGTDLIFLE